MRNPDWSGLEHAYGSARDLPDRLAGLLSGDPEIAGEALGVLDAAVLHQGSIYSATAPAALFVAGILGDERTGIPCESALPWDERVRPLRAALLEWLGAVGDSAIADDEHGCREIIPALFRAVAPFLDNPDPSVRTAALTAAESLLMAPGMAGRRSAVAGRLMQDAPQRTPAERAHLALVLARWGIPPRALLTDPDQAVRAYAAVAGTLDDEPVALAEVRAALRDPGAVNGWFGGGGPQRSGWFLETLATALLRRTESFEDVETEALAVATAAQSYARQAAIRTLLPRAFPMGSPPSPAALRFRAALNQPGG